MSTLRLVRRPDWSTEELPGFRAHCGISTAAVRCPAEDHLVGWLAAMRVFALGELPHPGAQIILIEAEDG